MASTRAKLALAFLLSTSATQLLGHELWLEPKTGKVTPGDEIEVSIRIGENLVGDEIPNLPHLQEAVDLSIGSNRFAIPSRLGDAPAFRFGAQDDALLVLRYESKPNFLTYESDEAFLTFLEEAQRPDIKERWLATRTEGSKVTEVFTRYAKTIIGIGSSPGRDVHLGMPFELVMLENPLEQGFDGSLTYRLMRDGKTAANAPVHVFHRKSDNSVVRIEDRTDSNGIFEVSVTEPGFYLVNAIDLNEADAAKKQKFGAQWKSDWASSSFRIE